MESISLESTEIADVEKSKYGQRMEYDAAGPYQKTRSRTDFCWLIGFIVYLVIWSIIIIYAFSVGDTSRFFKPSDSAGRSCGLDSGVEDKPHLMRFKSDSRETPYWRVCQSSCPESDFEFEDVADKSAESTESTAATEQAMTEPPGDVDGEEQGQNPTDSSPGANSELSREPQEKEQTVNSSREEPKQEPEARQKRDTRAQEKTGSEPGVPGEAPAHGNSTDQGKQSSTEPTTTRRTGEESAGSSTLREAKFDAMKRRVVCKSDVNLKLVKTWDDLRYLVRRGHCSRSYEKADCPANATIVTTSQRLDALSSTKFSILGFVLLSGGMALLSVLLMRWYAMMYVCVAIFASCALAFRVIYEECVLDAENKTSGVLLALFLGVVALVAVVLVAIYFRREIALACQMIEESTKAVTCVLSSLAVPLVFFALYLLICVLGVSVFFLLASLKSPVYRAEFDATEGCDCPSKFGYSHDSSCDPELFHAQCRVAPSGEACVRSGCYMLAQQDAAVGFLHFINVLGLVWLYWFLAGFHDTVLASVYSTWYWTFNKKILSYLSVVESFWRIGTYHLGTVVLGSLLIAVCKIVRAIFDGLERSLRKTKNPISAATLLCLLKCFGPAMEGFVRFTNRRAYIMCAMHGTDFFQSARTAFYLLMRNCKRVIAVTAVTNRITHLTAILIAGVTTRIAMGYYHSFSKEELRDPTAPLVLVGLGSYVIACMLMRVIEVAADTVFLCFLEDTERNDGTNDRPYFMSDELTKFLYVK